MNIPRESVEYLPITIAVDGETPEDYEVSVVPKRERPTTWTTGPYLIDGLDVGEYDAYVRVTDNPETPVKLAGTFRIT